MAAIVDFSYLEDMAEGKISFIHEVLSIFMDSTPKGLQELEKMVNENAGFEKIQKQAHFLKSSFGIVRVDGIHDRLQEIETLAREQKGREDINRMTDEIKGIFAEAEVLIKTKME